MHPSDPPTIISFSNPDNIPPFTHTNPLTPAPYTITKHNFILFSSQLPLIHIPQQNLPFKPQLNPPNLLLVHFLQNNVLKNNHLKT
ncbi:hypothetical protein, partial [Staphylococcus epidermidis]|uniref:hypothetical protein n=1 Tax=Staphylococcus epidermidis TaxID=1282 RepID=UPI0037D9B83C